MYRMLPEVLRFLSEYRFLVYGVILVLMMRFRPQGIFGGQSKKPFKLLGKNNKKTETVGGKQNVFSRS